MAKARQEDEWNRASALLAMLYNANRDPKKGPKHPADFNPHARKADRADTVVRAPLSALRDLFCRA